MTDDDDLTAALPPAPTWCGPGTVPHVSRIVDGYGGGAVCLWTREIPAEAADSRVWIEAEDRILEDGRVLSGPPRVRLYEPREGLTSQQARRLAESLLTAADAIALD
ncbi:hypothetical protein [Mycolicibacter arupensis]|uniref:hypothetical protein n=1 Tax=Mycolicibacter arupensis TaxID=342002 RepID=UPI00122CCB5C|nr:hypothetical protein [Mycolicibacter arupensis]KAA1430479.1 hypothetical protein F0402_13840 [Mycolicibacter arupensis]